MRESSRRGKRHEGPWDGKEHGSSEDWKEVSIAGPQPMWRKEYLQIKLLSCHSTSIRTLPTPCSPHSPPPRDPARSLDGNGEEPLISKDHLEGHHWANSSTVATGKGCQHRYSLSYRLWIPEHVRECCGGGGEEWRWEFERAEEQSPLSPPSCSPPLSCLPPSHPPTSRKSVLQVASSWSQENQRCIWKDGRRMRCI